MRNQSQTGGNLSPLLIYLNDLEEFLSQSGDVNGISFSNDDVDENTRIFLKLFILLYADDTVILADTAEDLQNALNNYQLYCNTWKLSINSSKAKVSFLLEEAFLIILLF